MHRDPDCLDTQGSRYRREGQRPLPSAWHFDANLLQLEEQIRRPERVRTQAHQGAEAEHSKLKRMHADLAMGNDALKELLEKKP